MKTTHLIKAAVFSLLALTASSAYANMTQDANAIKQTDIAVTVVADDVITKDVQAKIVQQVPAMNVQVTTQAGAVTLTGAVDNQAQADTAVQLAKSVNGVKDVKSTIQVQAKK